jgi:Domain of unknown function (DUF5916)
MLAFISEKRARQALVVLTFANVLSLSAHLSAQTETLADISDDAASVPLYGRDADGHITVRALRLAEPLTIDGRLDEDVYQRVPPLGPFVQQEPDEGAAPTEATDAWIFFDDRNIYVSVRCWDSHPERIVANELRRDHVNIFQNDSVTLTFDTFHDLRTGVFFQTNPVGGLRDQEVIDERNGNVDWNTVWDVKSRLFDRGWAAEFVIPFKSLRYRGGGAQTWGVNLRRVVRWKNEWTFLSLVPKSYGSSGSFKLSSSATLVGLEVPSDRPPLELKPYGIAGLTETRNSRNALTSDGTRDVGFDFKYGLTKSLTSDFTYNTDFAQVEADEQQVNLTRFSLFFPEKRDFFLESQGIFEFGPSGGVSGQAPNITPTIFFSRRVGLSNGRPIPIVAGGRVTGRAGSYAIGALQIRTDDEPSAGAVATDFSVVRIRRDILQRSTIGMIATSRSPRLAGTDSNQVFGADAKFSLFENVLINSYYARSRTSGEHRDQASYLGQFAYAADRYGLNVEHLSVGDGFNPEAGFLRRDSFRRTYGQARFSPRPARSRFARRYSYEGSLDYITAPDNVLESRRRQGAFRIDINNGDGFDIEYTQNYERLKTPFAIASGVTIVPGGYDFADLRAGYSLGPQRGITGFLSIDRGSFYSGTKTEARYNGRMELTPRFAVEPRVSINWVRLPEGDFTARVLGARPTYTFSPRMFLSALVQHTSTSNNLSSNIRFRWEYQPGSDLFVVYADSRDTGTLNPGVPALQGRSIAVKLTRLVRF